MKVRKKKIIICASLIIFMMIIIASGVYAYFTSNTSASGGRDLKVKNDVKAIVSTTIQEDKIYIEVENIGEDERLHKSSYF